MHHHEVAAHDRDDELEGGREGKKGGGEHVKHYSRSRVLSLSLSTTHPCQAPRDKTYHCYELRCAQLLHLERHDDWCRCWQGRVETTKKPPGLFLSLHVLCCGGKTGEWRTDWALVENASYTTAAASSPADGQDALMGKDGVVVCALALWLVCVLLVFCARRQRERPLPRQTGFCEKRSSG